MPRRTNRLRWVLVFVVLVSGVYFFWHRSELHEASQKAAATPLMTVSVVMPKQATLQSKIHASGLVVAKEEVVVNAALSGVRITQVLVDEGKWVKKGQPLARLDPASLKNQVAQLEAQYKEAQIAYGRVEKIRHSGAISPSEVDQKRAAFDAAKAQLKDAQLKVSQATLVAPTAGLVYERTARIGALVGSGDPLFRIAQEGNVELEATLAEADLALLKPGQPATMTFNGRAQPVAGKIRLISPRVDNATRAAKLRITLPKNEMLPIGTFAEAEIATAQSSGLVLPQTALGLDNGAPLVWLVDSEHKTHALPVQVTFRDGAEAIVNGQGLGPDSIVIAKAGAFLHEGDLVAIAAEPAAENAK